MSTIISPSIPSTSTNLNTAEPHHITPPLSPRTFQPIDTANNQIGLQQIQQQALNNAEIRERLEEMQNAANPEQSAAIGLALNNPQAFLEIASLLTLPQTGTANNLPGTLPTPSLNVFSNMHGILQSQLERPNFNRFNTLPQLQEQINNDPGILGVFQGMHQVLNTPEINTLYGQIFQKTIEIPEMQVLCRRMLEEIHNDPEIQGTWDQINLRTLNNTRIRNNPILQEIFQGDNHQIRAITDLRTGSPLLLLFLPTNVLALRRILSELQSQSTEGINVLINDFNLFQRMLQQMNNNRAIQGTFQEILEQINNNPEIQALFQQMQQSMQNNQNFQQLLQHVTPQQRTTLQLALEDPVSVMSLIFISDTFSRLANLTHDQCTDVDVGELERMALLGMAQNLPNLLSTLPQTIQAAIQAQQTPTETNWFYRFIHGIENILKSIWNLIKGLFCC